MNEKDLRKIAESFNGKLDSEFKKEDIGRSSGWTKQREDIEKKYGVQSVHDKVVIHHTDAEGAPHISDPMMQRFTAAARKDLETAVAKGIIDGSVVSNIDAAGEAMKLPADRLINITLDKMGRHATEPMQRAIKDYMIRNSIPLFAEKVIKSEPEDFDPDTFLDEMAEALKSAEGVIGAQPLMNDYPESATIIVKINMSTFEDEEVEKWMGHIDTVIQNFKPKKLDKLEVIYHNKVVY
jgi:hypothetical protein